jgi:hypothetical protein
MRNSTASTTTANSSGHYYRSVTVSSASDELLKCMSYHPARRVLAVAGKNTYIIAVSDEHYLSDDDDDNDRRTNARCTRRRSTAERRHTTKTAGLQKVSGVGSRSTLVDWSISGALAVADPKGLSVYDCVTADRVANSTIASAPVTQQQQTLVPSSSSACHLPVGTRGVSQKPLRNWIINSSISNQTPTSRAKSAIAWDPHNPHVLAHASLVCALELSDTRTPLQLGQGCAATVGAQGHDISFSPTKPFMIAVAADQSSGVLLFDQRKFSTPVVTIPTPAMCTAVSFHPLYTDLLAYSYQPYRNQPNAIIAFHNVATIPCPATATSLPHSLLFGSGAGGIASHVSEMPSGSMSVSQYSSVSVGGGHLQHPLWEVDTSKGSLYGPCAGLAPISCAWRQDRIRWRPTTSHHGSVTPTAARYQPHLIERVSPLWFATCSQTIGTTPHIWDALHSSTPLLSGHNLHVERNERGQVNVRDGGDVVWISPTTMISCGGRTVVTCNIGVDGGGDNDDDNDVTTDTGDMADCASTLWNQPASLQCATFSATGFGEYVTVRDAPEQRVRMQATIWDSIAMVASVCADDTSRRLDAAGEVGAIAAMSQSGPLVHNGSNLKVGAPRLPTESPQIAATAGGLEPPPLSLGGGGSSHGVQVQTANSSAGGAAQKKSLFNRIFGNDNKSSSKTRGPSVASASVTSSNAAVPHSPPSASLSALSHAGTTPHSGSVFGVSGGAALPRTGNSGATSLQMSPHLVASTGGESASAAGGGVLGTFPPVTQLPSPCIGDDLHRLVQAFRVPVPAGLIETITVCPLQLPKFSNHVVRTTRKQFRRLGQYWGSCYEAVVSLKTSSHTARLSVVEEADDVAAAQFASNHTASIANAKLPPSDPRCCIWASLGEAFHLHEAGLTWSLVTQALEYATQCGDVQLATFLYITTLVWWRQRCEVRGQPPPPHLPCVLLSREWRQRAFQFVASYTAQLEAMEMWTEWSELEYTFPYLVALPPSINSPTANNNNTSSLEPPVPMQQRSQLLDGGDTGSSTNPCFRAEIAQEKNREFLYCSGCQNLAVPAQALPNPTDGASGAQTNISISHSALASHAVARCKSCRGRLLHVCVICEQPVEGLYVWLKPCGHGGHWNHLAEWMQENDECPKCGVLLVEPSA